MHKVVHWGPLVALGIIKLVSWTTMYCTCQWLALTSSFRGILNAVVFFTLAYLTLYNFLSAMVIGPGFIPLGWLPDDANNKQYLQYCTICEGYKAPRSHHCKKCGRCVMKMDHHCPWINNCVGHLNHGHFTLFLLFAICGSIHSCTLLSITVYKVLIPNVNEVSEIEMPVKLSFSIFVLCLFSIGMDLGVFFALSFLFYIQMESILRNRSGIEDWILEKAEERRYLDPSLPQFIFPYNLGWRNNLRQVFYSGCNPQSDGIDWQVRQECSKYSLTIEQLKQKHLKNLRKKPYKVVHAFSGAMFPLVNGFCTCLRPPCSLDARIVLKIDDIVLVTRYQKYWLYGEKVGSDLKSSNKGWFPRSCVISTNQYENEINSAKIKNQ